MSDCILKVEKLENGYEVECVCPDTVKANKEGQGMYQDPWKSYAFQNSKDTIKFISESLDKLTPVSDEEEYSGSFARAIEED